ncbi:hypothetical protein BV20DRAFT_1058617 [Pilatotrama ljubarskyi]|nr:hypothetical protein BV20DRAFT_1058617 [Pilatotrama ljubarskyi]
MIVVDPMHNLFLGLVKSHFYHIWVQLKIFRKSKELNRVHEILAELALPSKLGRLPRLIGEPAGGSLTADQWLILATIVGPLAFPELWDGINHPEGDLTFFEERLAHIRREVASRKASRKSGKRKTPSSRSSTTANKSKVQTSEDGVRRSTRVRYPTEKAKDLVLEADDAGATLDDDDSAWMDVEDEDDSQQHSRLHQRDLATFLKLCMAIRLFLSESISEEQLVNADKLIREYCQDLIEVRL